VDAALAAGTVTATGAPRQDYANSVRAAAAEVDERQGLRSGTVGHYTRLIAAEMLREQAES